MELTVEPCPAAQTVRPAAVHLPGRPVPADRRRGRAQRPGHPGQARTVELLAPSEALDDALALRLAAIEAAEVVFRVCHQLHGAVGFCDETTLSWLSRYSQPLRRLPLGLSATRDELTRRLGRRGLTGSVLVTHDPDLERRSRRLPRRCAPMVQNACPRRLAQVPNRRRRRRIRPLPEGVVRRAAQRGLRRAALAPRVGRRHVGRRADRPLSGAGRPRRPPAGAGVRRNPPRRIDIACRRHRRAAAQAPARDPGRRNLGAGLLRTRGGIRPGEPADVGTTGSAIATWSTARSCGPAAAGTPTGACCSPAPTRKRPSAKASRISCST